MSHREHPSYFVILGIQRTGSNLLRTLLASHPEAAVYGEVFMDGGCWFEVDGLPPNAPEVIAERDADPLAFAEKYVFRPHPEHIRAVGFKLFYPQALQNDAALWSWLDQREDVTVLHLRRRNAFRQYVSHLVAESTGMWRTYADGRKPMPLDEVRLTVDPADCEQMMTRVDELGAAALARLPSRPVMELTYEGLCEDPDGVLGSVQQSLGLEPQPLTTTLTRQVTRPLRQLIENYDETARHFASTRWAECFDE